MLRPQQKLIHERTGGAWLANRGPQEQELGLEEGWIRGSNIQQTPWHWPILLLRGWYGGASWLPTWGHCDYGMGTDKGSWPSGHLLCVAGHLNQSAP